MGIINTCPLCHEKQQEINQLKDEIVSLKSRLRYRERKEKEGQENYALYAAILLKIKAMIIGACSTAVR